MELSQFAPYMVATEELRMNRFKMGLNWNLRERLSTHTYEQVGSTRKFERDRFTGENFPKQPNLGVRYQRPFCTNCCRTNQMAAQCRYPTPRCYIYGSPNHKKSDCPQAGSTIVSNATTSTPPMAQKPQGHQAQKLGPTRGRV
ncbi:hypothetical protein RND81_08G095300 [Saponaria officinalis]|uniref:Uncharacterized protein n=1 Tax=Saponaria officinalis TaxID=3572 RepID=A0AAW1J5F7_SAPOF